MNIHSSYAEPTLPIVTILASENRAHLESRILDTNCALEEAARHIWSDRVRGAQTALRVMKQFAETAGALEACGWPAERIKECLEPSRKVFATSSFMRRCQEWPRGYAGDFETIEYLFAGVNQSLSGTLGWHIENTLLQSPVVQQHHNKLKNQSREIIGALMRSRTARVLSVGCGGCLDWVPVLPHLKSFSGEIVLNDCEPAALELAERRLRPVTTHVRLVPGNVIRMSKRLAQGGRFDLVLAGGLFDYLPDRASVYLLRVIAQDLLTPGGVLLFTNIAEGNPWRRLMEYGSNWNLVERSETSIFELCREAGIPDSCILLQREDTGLTLIARVVL